jgi:hypothetical protein
VMNYRYSEVLQNLFKYYRIDRDMKKRYLEQK